MESKEPLIFKLYPNLKGKVPWIPILKNVPTPIDRLLELEKHLDIENGAIFIKRDDLNHETYSGNKLRKFEFICADAIKKKKKGMMTFGGIGTNHGLACALVAKEINPPLKCDIFLADQPLTWHVQRSLLLFDYFGANLHYAKSYGILALKGLLFRLFHPKYYFMLPGGSSLLGKGTPLGTIGFMNALFELKSQIDEGSLPSLDAIFVAGGSTGTAAGLIAGCKVLGLKTKVYVTAVSDELFVNKKAIAKNCNKALIYLQKRDPKFPDIEVEDSDFELISGYLGSEYGIKTKRGQKAVDLVMKLEGYDKGFKLETTYTGKTMAAMLDFLKKSENKSKKVLFWNTYNSNDLNQYLKEINFNWKNLPKKFYKFYANTNFQCWQLKECPKKSPQDCPAYLNHEYRCWRVKKCSKEDQEMCDVYQKLSKIIELEDA